MSGAVRPAQPHHIGQEHVPRYARERLSPFLGQRADRRLDLPQQIYAGPFEVFGTHGHPAHLFFGVPGLAGLSGGIGGGTGFSGLCPSSVAGSRCFPMEISSM
ncbi:hypothetical protein [Embleya sp. AB8]|uniref:hypothetical protein n=1 Tax=Embleya sp. AB8 TaxID=3156304 RepID=UPI003C736D42